MKKTLCLILAAIAVAALFAGCETKDLDGKTTGTTGPHLDLTPDIVNDVMKEAGITGTELSPEEEALLQSKLAEQGYDVTIENGGIQVKPPEGVTLPPETEAPTEPPPMPTGVAVASNAEAVALLEGLQSIFKSKTFTLKAKTSSAVSIGIGGFNAMTMVVDKDRIALEGSGNLGQLFTMGDEKEDYAGQKKVRAAIIETFLGRTFRLVMGKDKMLYAFPDRKTYIDLSAMLQQAAAEGGEEGEEFDLSEALNFESILDQMFGLGIAEETTVKQSKVTDGGKEYICATIEKDGVASNFYFLGKDLKRIEMVGPDPDDPAKTTRVVTEIESLTGTVDPKYFDTKNMTPIDMGKLAEVLGGSSLLGG